MNAVITTLVILVASVVLGTGVILYGTSLFNESTNSTSNSSIVKPVVTYYKIGVDPTVETENYTEKSVILAVDSQSYQFLLTNGKTIDPIGTNLIVYKNHAIINYGVNTYDGYDINSLAGSNVTIHYSTLKPTCVYVFNWRHDFHSRYNVDGFNFTHIPNATNYDFVLTQGYGNSCNDTIKNIQKVEVYLK